MRVLARTTLSRKFVFYGRDSKHDTIYTYMHVCVCVCVCVCVSGCHIGERNTVVVNLIELFRAGETDLLPARQSFGHDTSVSPSPPPLPTHSVRKFLLFNFSVAILTLKVSVSVFCCTGSRPLRFLIYKKILGPAIQGPWFRHQISII
jgi:hypothetical protein